MNGMESLEKLIEEISKESGKPVREVREMVEEKKSELSGLVSDEGAAYIVGRELGVSLLKEGRRLFKIRDLAEGLKNVDLAGRIMRISDIREFSRDGKKGRVQSIVLGDETGTIRLPLWNEEIDSFSNLEISEDDVLLISNGWVKLDNKGQSELRIGRGNVRKGQPEDAPPKSEIKFSSGVNRKEISSLVEGETAEIRASIVQIFRKNPFFEVCPECGSKVFVEDGKERCKEHGIVKPQPQLILSAVLDDGSGNIRAVFFRDLAERLFGEKALGLKQLAQKKGDLLSIFDDFPSMGKDFVVRGRARKNDFTGNLEFVVNDVQDCDPVKEANSLLEKAGKSV